MEVSIDYRFDWTIRYLSEFDTWKWGILPKIPWFKASFSLLELQFGGYTPFSDTPIFIFDIQGKTPTQFPADTPLLTHSPSHESDDIADNGPSVSDDKGRIRAKCFSRKPMQCTQTLDWSVDVCILKVCNGDGFASREIYRNQAPLIWFKQSHFSAEMRAACQAVDTAQMSLELPPRSDHTSGSGSLHSKDWNPPPQKKTGFLQKQTSLLHPTWSYGHNQSECHPHHIRE
jgi:hypothetical protein